MENAEIQKDCNFCNTYSCNWNLHVHVEECSRVQEACTAGVWHSVLVQCQSVCVPCTDLPSRRWLDGIPRMPYPRCGLPGYRECVQWPRRHTYIQWFHPLNIRPSSSTGRGLLPETCRRGFFCSFTSLSLLTGNRKRLSLAKIGGCIKKRGKCLVCLGILQAFLDQAHAASLRVKTEPCLSVGCFHTKGVVGVRVIGQKAWNILWECDSIRDGCFRLCDQ